MYQVGPLFLSLECFFILLFSIERDFQAFLDVLEQKENDSTVKVNPPLRLLLLLILFITFFRLL